MTDRNELVKQLKIYTQEYLDKPWALYTIMTALARSDMTHLYKELFPQCKTVSEQVYWLMHDLNDFPKCHNCGKSVKSYINYNLGYTKFCSQKCGAVSEERKLLTQATSIKKYGTLSPNQSSIVKKHKSESCESKYGKGITNVFKLDSVKKTIAETNLKKLGVVNPMQSQKCKDKAMNTNMLKRGVKWTLQDPEVRQKSILSLINNYGVDNASKSDIVKAKIKEVWYDKYGVFHISQNEDIKKLKAQKWANKTQAEKRHIVETRMMTNIERYGVPWTSQNSEIFAKMIKHLYFNGMYFDSASELLYYFYLIRNNIDFQYHNGTSISYTINGIIHRYFPDFYIVKEKRFHEIKGDYFFENSKMICPYDRSLDEMYEFKHQAMIQNDVVIITETDLKKLGIVGRNDLIRKFCKFLEDNQISRFNLDISDINDNNYQNYVDIAFSNKEIK